MQVLNHQICKQRATRTIITFKMGYNHDHLSSLCTFVAHTCATSGEKVTKLTILSIFGSKLRSRAALENFQASITGQLIPVNNVCKLVIVFWPKNCHIAGGASWSFCAQLKVWSYTPWSISFVTDAFVIYTRYKPLYVGFKIWINQKPSRKVFDEPSLKEKLDSCSTEKWA